MVFIAENIVWLAKYILKKEVLFIMRNDFLNAVDFSHFLLKENILKKDIVVDATAGNGNDTKFLAEMVGKKGKVYSFDIQEEAIKNTAELLKKENVDQQCNLIMDSHSQMEAYVEEEIAAAIFNLGYLPGGDKNITTKGESTLKALKSSLKLLKTNGIVILVVYSGHQGGAVEKEILLNFCNNLDYKKYNVLSYKFINQPKSPPEVIAIKKRK